MDTMTRKRTEKFAKEWEIESLGIEKQFELYVNSVILRTICNNDDVDFETATVAGGDDNAIDGIALIVNGTIFDSEEALESHINDVNRLDVELVCIQSKTSEKYEISEINNFLLGIQLICKYLVEGQDLSSLGDLAPVAKLIDLVLENSEKISGDSGRIRLLPYYVTTSGGSTATIESAHKIQAMLKTIDDYSLFESGFELNLYGSKELLDIARTLSGLTSVKFTFDQKGTLPEAATSSVAEAYVGIVSAENFANIISPSGNLEDSLFRENVRAYQGENNPVNEQILSTLRSEERALFPFLNNGVTIVADNAKGTGNTFTISSYQVVNGCQTTNQFFRAWKELGPEAMSSVYIPLKLIVSNDPDLLEKVTIASNSQSPVDDSSMIAVNRHAMLVEEYFEETSASDGLRFQRQPGVYQNRDSVAKVRVFGIDDLNRAFAAVILGESRRAIGQQIDYRKEPEIVWAPYPVEFYYFAARVVYRIDSALRNQKFLRLRALRLHIAWLCGAILLPDLDTTIKKAKEVGVKESNRKLSKFGRRMAEEIDDEAIDHAIEEAVGIVESALEGTEFDPNLRETNLVKDHARRPALVALLTEGLEESIV